MVTFDNYPVVYYTIGNMLIIFAASLSVYSFWNDKFLQNRGWIILSLCLLILVMMRLPVIVINQAFNPDENLFIVGAMTLTKEPIYWHSVDGATSGPLNFYIITLFCELFHQPYDYISARIVGILLMSGSVIFSFLALQKLFSQTISFLSVLPAVVFLGTTHFPDFIHYSSEHLPIFLLSILGYLYASINNQKQVKSSSVFVFGLVAGLLTLSKLQAIPIGAFLTLATYWLIYYKSNKIFVPQTLWLTFGGGITLITTLLLAFYFNVTENIWLNYLRYNLSYGSKTSIFYTIYKSLFEEINIFIRIIMVLGVMVLVYNFFIKRQFKLSPNSVFVTTFLSSTLLCVYKTGFVFEHYLLFLIFPTVFLYAFFLNDLFSLSKKIQTIVFLSVIAIYVLSSTLVYPIANNFITAEKPQRPLAVSEAGKKILKYSQPNEALVVWGDAGRLYLETKRIQGITWSNSYWGMYSDSLQRHFEDSFVKEFTRETFPIFVDAHPTNNVSMTRKKLGYENKPILKQIIDTKYTLVGDSDGQRVFVRNERYLEVNKLDAQAK